MVLSVGGHSVQEYVDREKGLVSRDYFVSPELYDLEQERVFTRCWLFIGFEDQVAKPGDYFVSRMGEESVILTRDRQGKLHVFLNSCRHRGMKVCRYDEGNTPVFTCPFHGWSYGLGGQLVGVPHFKDAYHSEVNKEAWGLIEVAQMHNFKGTIWATWDPETPPFEEYLGDNLLGLGLFFDHEDGSDADIEVLGLYKWVIPSNWKFPAENFCGDGAHNVPTHRSQVMVGAMNPDGSGGLLAGGRGHPFNLAHHGSGRAGFMIADDLPYTLQFPNNPVADEYYRQVYERRKQNLGERWRVSVGFGIGNVFPNASQGQGRSMCVWQPNSVDSTEAWRWYFVDRNMPKEVKDMWRHYYQWVGGPAGLMEQDDMENWEYAQKASKGTIAKRYPYHYAMGMGHELTSHPAFDQFGIKFDGLIADRKIEGSPRPNVTEQNVRVMAEFWADLMEAEGWSELRATGRWP